MAILDEILVDKLLTEAEKEAVFEKLLIFWDFRNDEQKAYAHNVEPGIYFTVLPVNKRDANDSVLSIIHKMQPRMKKRLMELGEFDHKTQFEALRYGYDPDSETLVIRIEPHRL
jgi:hypothetical protein